MIKVLVVDDIELIRTGIKGRLANVNGIKVVGEAASGEEAIQKTKELRPNVVIMDLQMPGIGGLGATKRLIKYDPDLKIIALTVCDADPFPARLIKAGAMGYLVKDCDTSEMLHAIKTVMMNQRYLSPKVAQQLAMKHVLGEKTSPLEVLSERELQIMIMITSGQKAQDIAEQLHISSKTVNSYRYRIFEKLKVQTDVELTHMAIRLKLVDLIVPEEDD